MVCLVMMMGAARAGSVAGFGGGTEVTQLLNFGELVYQTETQYEQWVLQYERIKQLKIQMEKGINVPFGQIKQMVSNVSGLVHSSQALGYNSQLGAAKWDSLYPDFNHRTGTNYFEQYKNWSKNSGNAIKTAMEVNGFYSDPTQFATEEKTRETLEQVVNEANTSGSTIAVVNAANQIALSQVDETKKLRQIQTAQNVAQTTYLQQQQQVQDTKTAQDDVLRQMYKDPPQTRTYQQIQIDNQKRRSK